MKKYPKESIEELWKTARTDWYTEGLDLAERVVYDDVMPDKKPSDEYLARGLQAAEVQIAKAGFRLSRTLTEIWGQRGQEDDLVTIHLTKFLE